MSYKKIAVLNKVGLKFWLWSYREAGGQFDFLTKMEAAQQPKK